MKSSPLTYRPSPKQRQRNWSRAVGIALLLILLVSGFGVWNSLPQEDDYLKKSLLGSIPLDNEELLRYIRNELLVEPSQKPYNLQNDLLTQRTASQQFFQDVVQTLFQRKRNGFFVEALECEAMSNTLELEMKMGWKGVLIEPNSACFQAVQEQNRRAWSANFRLSPKPYPLQIEGQQLIPLESVLHSVGSKKVDLLSLDFEDEKMDILKHFAFHKLAIEVIFLQWRRPQYLKLLKNFMKEKGYRHYKSLQKDLVFIKNESVYWNDYL